MRIRDCVFFLCLILTQTLCFASELSSEALDNADYISGKTTFQQRCSACHTLAENSANLVGPNLWHIFDQTIGKVTGFSYSEGMKESELISKRVIPIGSFGFNLESNDVASFSIGN